MTDVLHWIGALLVTMGALLTLIAAIGISRFPNFFSRLHASSVAETGGVILLVLGLLCFAHGFADALRLFILMLLLLATAPIATHALANAALRAKSAANNSANTVLAETDQQITIPPQQAAGSAEQPPELITETNAESKLDSQQSPEH